MAIKVKVSGEMTILQLMYYHVSDVEVVIKEGADHIRRCKDFKLSVRKRDLQLLIPIREGIKVSACFFPFSVSKCQCNRTGGGRLWLAHMPWTLMNISTSVFSPTIGYPALVLITYTPSISSYSYILPITNIPTH